MLRLYLSGELTSDWLSLPLPSTAVVFVLQYCQLKDASLVLIPRENIPKPGVSSVRVPRSCVSGLVSVETCRSGDLPLAVVCCQLPVVQGDADSLIRCGLCSCVRYIAQRAHHESPQHFIMDILGFRGCSLKSCAEVSGWTRFCEVELHKAVETFKTTWKKGIWSASCESEQLEDLVVPPEIERLNSQLNRPVYSHNINQRKEQVVRHLRKMLTRGRIEQCLHQFQLSAECHQDVVRFLQQDIPRPHCWTKFKILREFNGLDTVIPPKTKRKKKQSESRKERVALRKVMESEGQNLISESDSQNGSCEASGTPESMERFLRSGNGNSSGTTGQCIDWLSERTEQLSVSPLTSGADEDNVECVLRFVHSLTAKDIHLEHSYLEGIDLTLADLILFIFIQNFLDFISSKGLSLCLTCPSLLRWFDHMTSLDRVRRAAEDCGISLSLGVNQSTIEMISASASLHISDDFDPELRHRSKEKYRPLKHDVSSALLKVQTAGIVAEEGAHPSGEDVHLDWDTLPTQLHPAQGDLRANKGRSKCEQIENLASAVVAIAQPGHAVVDFCSGGGHVGIVVAYLLPQCQVYLVENKEESLTRAKNRVDRLRLANVTLLQCNLDYFCGQFDIGVCLHGCGVATDMVLRKCLDNMAAFVVCPCCYGKVQTTSQISYPCSERFKAARITTKDYIVLGHAADQTEVGIELEEQGRYCSKLVDMDRGMLFQQNGYSVTLCSLQPLTCTTKNNLLIGVPPT